MLKNSSIEEEHTRPEDYVNYAERQIRFLTSFSNQLVGPRHHRMTLKDHIEHCSGCEECLLYRYLTVKARALAKSEAVEGSGITVEESLNYRKITPIRTYFPQGDEFLNKNVPRTAPASKRWNKNVYLFLKMQDGSSKSGGFTDDEIREYFAYRTGCNTGDMLAFKKQVFPNWTADKDKIIAEEGPAVIEWYRSHFNHGVIPRVQLHRTDR